MISLLKMTLTYWRIVVWKHTMDFIRPVTILCLDDELSYPWLSILSWRKSHLYRSTFPSIRLQLSWFRMNVKINPWIWSKICMIFRIGLISICQSKFNRSRVIYGCGNLEFIINRRRQEVKVYSEYPFRSYTRTNLKESPCVFRL